MFIGVLLLAGAVWFDGAVARDIVRQRWATYYAVTEGVITSSRVSSESAGDGGGVYSLAVTYDYSVGGRAFVGDHYYVDDAWGATSDAWAEVTARALPQGKRVPVYYPPEDPARAVLAPGITGGQLLLALVGFPLTLIPAAVISGARRRKAGGREPVHEEVAERSREAPAAGFVRAVFARLTPLGGAAMGACAAAFSALTIILILLGGHPPIAVPVVAWIAVLAAALSGYLASRRRQARSFSRSAAGPRTRNTTPSSV